jgi:hypothetical protein
MRDTSHIKFLIIFMPRALPPNPAIDRYVRLITISKIRKHDKVRLNDHLLLFFQIVTLAAGQLSAVGNRVIDKCRSAG